MSDKFKIISHNIRFSNKNDYPYDWDNRKDTLIKMIKEEEADILCLQEVTSRQLADLKNLTNYDFTYKMRDTNSSSECLPILINSNKFKKIDSGHFWISETPDTSSCGWDSSLPRVVSWVVATDLVKNKNILIINVHLDHKGVNSRDRGIKLIKKFVAKKENEYGLDATFVLGDFNSTSVEPWYLSMVEEDYIDVRKIKNIKHDGPIGTCTMREFDEKLPYSEYERIDYIWLKKYSQHTNVFETDHLIYTPFMISDHLPLVLKLDM